MRIRASPTPGFSLVEILLAIAIFGFMSLGLAGAIIYGRTSALYAGHNLKAAYLADEGLQAATAINNANFATPANGSTIGINSAGVAYTASGTSDTVDIFTRAVHTVSAGTDRKLVTSTITWPQSGSNTSLSLRTRLTNWAADLPAWSATTQVGTINTAGNTDNLKVAISGNYAYVISNTAAGFRVFDITDPTNPVLVTTLTLASAGYNLFISGNYAYVAETGNNSEMQIVNISNPATPTIVGTYNAQGNADGRAVFVSGARAYLVRPGNGGNGNEFQVINVTNPAAPTLLGFYTNNVTMNDVKVSGNYAFVGTASTTQDILVIDISNPATPKLATSYNLPATGDVTAIAIVDTTLYIGLGSNLLLRDITNPLASTEIGDTATTNTINDLAVDSSNYYVFMGTTNGSAELQIAGVANPAAPEVIATLDMEGNNVLNGVIYSTTLNKVVAVGNSDNEELVIYSPN